MNYEDIFSKGDLKSALCKYFDSANFEILSDDLGKASDELIGFLGEHLRMRVKVRIEDKIEDVHLFIKMIPVHNTVQADYIKKNYFFQKEFTVYKMFDSFKGYEEPSPWMINALHLSDALLIMEDVGNNGFKPGDRRKLMDVDQCYAAIETLAKFHAASVLLERRKTTETGKKFAIDEEYPIIDAPNNVTFAVDQAGWFICGYNSLITYIGEVSTEYGKDTKHFSVIRDKIPDLFKEASLVLEKSPKFLNVIVHTDLWASNFLLRYKGSSKTPDVILADFQCVKYAPGTVDIAAFLYLNTNKSLRDEYEIELLKHYTDVFNRETLDVDCPRKTISLEEVVESFNHSRIYGFVTSILLYPYILLDGDRGNEIYNDPELFDFYNDIDRSKPMIDTALSDKLFGERMLAVTEEFIERYIINPT